MHGIIHAQLKQFVETNHGVEAWRAVLDEAGLAGKVYLANGAYADEDAVAIVTAASKLTGPPAADILEGFGEFIVPALMSTYKSSANSSCRR